VTVVVCFHLELSAFDIFVDKTGVVEFGFDREDVITGEQTALAMFLWMMQNGILLAKYIYGRSVLIDLYYPFLNKGVFDE
jgi:hypothetical protein